MRFFINFILLLGLSSLAYGREKINLDYPELNIVPLASERIKMEAQHEGSLGLSFQWPITVSSLIVLTAGGVQTLYKDGRPNNYSPEVGIATGLGLIGANLYLAYFSEGYDQAYNEIKALPERTEREKLIKERLSEEKINLMARNARKMIWITSIANFAASIFMSKNAKKDSIGEYVDYFSAVTSIMPLLFNNRRIDVARSQMKYKKRIYGPIAGIQFLKNKDKIVPAFGFSYNF